MLARQSGEMPEEDQQGIVLKIASQGCRLAAHIQQRQAINRNPLHWSEHEAEVKNIEAKLRTRRSKRVI
jgi:hypothetical protein